MYTVGLTGGIATGKSTVSALLRQMAVPVIDADEISRRATAQGGEALPAIAQTFGLSYFDAEGRLSRRKLGEAVFTDQSLRAVLNGIVHPIVKAGMAREMERLRAAGSPLVVLDVPLLYEVGMEALCDEVWCVTTPPDVQLHRLMARDALSQSEANARIDSQMPLAKKAEMADLLLQNDGDLDALAEQVRAAVQAAQQGRSRDRK